MLKDIKDEIKAIAERYERAKGYLNHALRTLGKRKLHDMIELAKSVEPVPVRPDQLDQYHMLLPAENGVIDLKNGDLLPHDPAYLFTRRMPVAYDKEATCPKWEKALYDMMGGPLGDDSPDDSAECLEARYQQHERAMRLVAFLQRSFGYMLTGTTHEQLLWLFTGAGSNGKSVVIDTLLTLFGDYGHKATQGLFEEKQFDTHLTERASLFGRRLVATTEGKEGRRLDASFVKEATGGDPITVRRMREDPWTFLPTHHIILVTNHLPRIDDHSHGMWRRVRVVPLDVTFEDPDTADEAILNHPTMPKQNKHLAKELLEELAGILRWCVEGCLHWQQDGLTFPHEVRLATEGYQRDMNNLEAFVREGCLSGPTNQTRAKALYEGYKAWCEVNEEHPCDQKAFGQQIAGFGHKRTTRRGVRWYLGIAVKDWDEDANDTAEDCSNGNTVERGRSSHQ